MKAVITGDIVGSTYFQEPDRLVRSLELILTELESNGFISKGMWEIYRGDSFQILLEAEKALQAGILLRSGLIGMIYRLKTPLILEDVLEIAADARISIAIGSVEKTAKRVSSSFGEAFILSGKMLDEISQEELKIILTSSRETLNSHFDIICRLLDIVMGDWTANSAQAVYRSLLLGETQVEAARFLNISQSSVQNRLKIAHFDEIKRLLSYYQNQLTGF